MLPLREEVNVVVKKKIILLKAIKLLISLSMCLISLHHENNMHTKPTLYKDLVLIMFSGIHSRS